MADLYHPNKASPAGSGADYFSYLWYQTRLMMKAGWRHLASSDATNKVTTVDPTTCKWGAPAALGGQTGAVASITTQAGLDYNITGLTGLVAPSKTNQGGSEGNYLTITGAASGGNNTTWQITKVVSATACLARPVAGSTPVANDANNGAISWTEKSALTTAYAAMANGAWLNLQGPSTLKIPFTVAPTGTFIRGENIVQATTGAEGECLGVTYEPSTGAGYMVVAPRLSGTGADVRGWDHSHVVTGAKSGATFTPSATPIEFVREMVFWRGSTLLVGTIYYQVVDASAESASRYSVLAGSAGCTATIAPAGGGTGNAYPAAGSYVVIGTGGSASHAGWNRTPYSTANALGNGQYFVANCIDKQNVSPDGTVMSALGQNVSNAQSAGGFPAFFRLDGGEEGDVEPYSSWPGPSRNGGGNQAGLSSRTAFTDAPHANVPDFWMSGGIATQISVGGTTMGHRSWRNRGLASGDAYQEVHGFQDNSVPYGNAMSVASSLTDPEKVASTAMTTKPFVFETIRIGSAVNLVKTRKGSIRWAFLFNGNLGYDTFGAKAWAQFGTLAAGDVAYQPISFPWDGSTVPVQ